jgi:6-pyruvoyltetrahydropterin/6-carboxytetrahydropterin synthase
MNRTAYITRREHFNAAHKLWVDEWSDEKNFEMFGKCANPNWHGHNYNLFVTVKGSPDPVTGLIIDLKYLSVLIRKEITEHLDHRNLNMDVDFLKGIKPSTENLAMVIWDRLNPHIEAKGCKLHSIKLAETENNSAEYFGE